MPPAEVTPHPARQLTDSGLPSPLGEGSGFLPAPLGEGSDFLVSSRALQKRCLSQGRGRIRRLTDG